MASKPTLGEGVALDVPRLIESRLLIQANSGAGKSWAIRRLLEQTYDRVPQIVIDVEGEFHTLRESFDYVLAGQKGGDCPADLKSAAMLARRLLELNVSAIVDIYELGVQRTRFVKLFLESLVNAPRDLWHPLLVVVDEAHLFAPEAGQSESASALIDLMTRGRKRGFCGVLATQRIAKLHKDAAAEANNKLIGRSALDIDMKRAAAELGMTGRDEMQALRKLPAGEFYAFGPALSDEVRLVKVGAVRTTHPKAGERAGAPTPPSASMKKLLGQLADLPAEAEAEARTAAELRARVKQLEGEVRSAKHTAPTPKVVERSVFKDAHVKRFEAKFDAFDKRASTLDGELQDVRALVVDLRKHLVRTTAPASAGGKAPVPAPPPTRPRAAVARSGADRTSTSLPVGEAATLRALIQFPDGLRREQLTILTGYKRSTRDAYVARLRERGFVAVASDRVAATAEGAEAIPDAEPLPTGADLRAWWDARLPSGERAILACLVAAYPEPVARTSLEETTGFKRSTRDAYISRLAARQLLEDAGGGRVVASSTLFEEAPRG